MIPFFYSKRLLSLCTAPWHSISSVLFQASLLWRERERVRRRLVHAEAVNEKNKTRPTHRAGILGLFRPPVDSIDYYRAQQQKNEEDLEEERRSNASSTTQKGAAIVIFNNRAAATCASQVQTYSYSRINSCFVHLNACSAINWSFKIQPVVWFNVLV